MYLAEGVDSVNAVRGGDTRVTRATLASQVEDAIKLDIIAGALESGQRLRASELTQRYGVSATPLREALQRLAAQSLVELGPRLGATVASLSESEFRDIYWLRGVLEPVALERSIQLGAEAWERKVIAAYEALQQSALEDAQAIDGQPSSAQIVSWSKVHRAFHDALFDACDSPWLVRFVQTLSDHSERYRILSHRRARRHPLQEHEAIYAAAIARDAGEAVAALRRHLSTTVDLLHSGRSEAPDIS